jgi:Flp pilus assembly protein TadG
MLKLLNTKILLALLAVSLTTGGYLYHEHEVNVRAADAAAKAAAILEQQQAADAAAKKNDAETWEFVRKQHQKNNVNPVNGSKAWTHYLP